MREERESSGRSVDEECKRAAKKAMDLLLRQDRTEKNLRERLSRSGFSEKASEYAIRYVVHFGYVDDLRYAQNYIFLHKGKRSKKELRYRLLDKGVPPELVTEAFLEYKEEEEYEAFQSQLAKRLKGQRLSDMDVPARDKIVAYFARKGYSFPLIRSVMREWMEGERE